MGAESIPTATRIEIRIHRPHPACKLALLASIPQ